MPGEWQYHADGVSTGLTTSHRLDGSLSTVSLQLDAFRVRTWQPEETEEKNDKLYRKDTGTKLHAHWDEREEVFEEHRDGSHATIKFDVDEGKATLRSIKPEDGEELKPRHMMLLSAAERIVLGLTEVGTVENPMDTLVDVYIDPSKMFIDALDA